MENDLLERAADLVMDAGQTLLENGGEVFRVQQTMEIMAHSLGVRDFHVYVLTNGIFASASMGSAHNVSLIRHVPSVSIHLGRVEAINELSRELAAGRLGVEEAEARLQQARSVPRTSPAGERLACIVGWVRLPFWRYTVGRRRGYRGGPAGNFDLPVVRPA